MSFQVTRTVRPVPALPYERMKNAVLGRAYELSLTFLGEARARKLNREHRRTTYVPNVLSFPLSRSVGEIYIAPKVAAREAPSFNMTTRGYIGYLFIHGLLHLKGYRHGDTMEKAEKVLVTRFRLK